MAMNCLLKKIPASFRECARRYVSTAQSPRACSILKNSELNYKPVHGHQRFVLKQNAAALPLLQHNLNQYWSQSQKINFSVSSKLQSKETENHSKLWSVERIVALSLLGVVPTALIAPSQPVECILAVALVMHNHWGIEAVVVDYVRPMLFGPVIPKIAHGLVYAMSIVTLVGLFYLIFDGCGIVNAIRLFWRL